jgi:3-phosphoglycerate kinase
MIHHIREVANLKERKVLVRVDFNVPIGKNFVVDESETWRIEKSLETINYLQKSGAKTILISHIGRDKKQSLKPVAEYLQKLLKINFVPTWDRDTIRAIVADMMPGDTILLENLRQEEGEELNDETFSSFLASLADMYVNEAFSVSHRAHASVVGVPEYLQSYGGFWFQKEIENLNKVMKNPKKPFLFILGGAKFETKIDLIKKFEVVSDEIFIGGALANNFFETIGFNVGKSLVDKNAKVSEFFNKDNIKIPFDVTVKGGEVREVSSVKDEDVIVDMGPSTLEELKKSILNSKTVLWNGPLGLYEEGYDGSSKEIIKTISESGAFSVVGGGDSVNLVKAMNLQDKISFVSTGGGAMLEFLAKGTLVGIEVLDQ